jgi:hypothetical protein
MPWASVISALILAVAGFFGGRATVLQNKSAPPPTPTTTPTVSAGIPLAFSLSSPASIPWCNDLTGSGTIPKGDSLAIFDSSIGNAQHYYFDGLASPTSKDAWSLAPVYIGQRNEAGLKDDIVGVLVTNQTARFIASILPGPPSSTAFWVSTALPPGLAYIHLSATRNADGTQCASGG